MSATQRRKGAVGERELRDALTQHLGGSWERTAQRCGKGGTADVRGPINGLHIECKRVARIRVEAFLEQAEADADGALPMVAMRADRGEWMVLMRLSDLPQAARMVEAHLRGMEDHE